MRLLATAMGTFSLFPPSKNFIFIFYFFDLKFDRRYYFNLDAFLYKNANKSFLKKNRSQYTKCCVLIQKCE